MAHILGISGSPHSTGNTAYAVQYALAAFGPVHEVRYMSLAGKHLEYCTGCFACSREPTCIFDDDMIDIYAALRWCDAVILGSPVYMGMVSGLMKTMMDRCVVFRPSYDQPLELSGKVGCGIACGGFRNGGQETTLQNIQTFLLQQNLAVVNDGFPFSHAGATIVGEAKDDELGLVTIRNLVARLAVAVASGASASTKLG